MSIWVYEYMSIWVYEYMSIWVYEDMSIWVHEYMSIWVYEYMSIWVYDRVYGYMRHEYNIIIWLVESMNGVWVYYECMSSCDPLPQLFPSSITVLVCDIVLQQCRRFYWNVLLLWLLQEKEGTAIQLCILMCSRLSSFVTYVSHRYYFLAILSQCNVATTRSYRFICRMCNMADRLSGSCPVFHCAVLCIGLSCILHHRSCAHTFLRATFRVRWSDTEFKLCNIQNTENNIVIHGRHR